MRLQTLAPAALVVLCACASAPEPPAGTVFPAGELVDLTHAFDSATVYWPTADGFELEVDFRGETDGGWYYEANTFRSAEHGGTHLDAPSHFARGGDHTDEIPLETLVGPAVVVDVSGQAARDRDYRATVEDLQRWEAEHGRLPEGVILLIRTGFGRFWPDPEAYLGTAARGEDAASRLHFPGLHPDAARWLTTRRRIAAVGLDTPSIDHGPSPDFAAHRVLFAENVPAFENVANLHRLPPVGAFVIALPMKIRGGSGGPLRIVAVVP